MDKLGLKIFGRVKSYELLEKTEASAKQPVRVVISLSNAIDGKSFETKTTIVIEQDDLNRLPLGASVQLWHDVPQQELPLTITVGKPK